ncbi:MAG: DNA polymerase III subunit alpha [Lachnospiraceae bacterium]|nr:DNA polymerase III subunit alpha [Lachnospiraceae bacterium]
MAFRHLHVHTQYSLLDGSSKLKELVLRAKELGMDSIAMTDHGVMYGAIDFYKIAKDNGIKPIIGCEIYVAPGSRFDREKSAGENRYNHLVLLAENNTGYENLMKIVSKGFLEGFYYKPRVDYEVLEEYHEGIIALSACLAGAVATNLRLGMYDNAKEEALKLNSIFGEGNFFLELQDHGIPEQADVNQGILKISAETGIPLVATNDIHYIYAEDAAAHDVLLCIQTQKKVNDEDRMRYEGGQYYLKSEQEMRALFPYAASAIDNTGLIADRCNIEITFNEYKLPKYDLPEEYDNDDPAEAYRYLYKLCGEGLVNRYGSDADKHVERMEYELGIIRDMGFVNYFLIVWDFIKYAKDNGIPVGPGRGSGAGSIVAYSLRITDIDPIKYNLLFERFLNPERVTMPDIDVDFCFERRQEVIDYVVRKYGSDRVVQIVTFGTMKAKNAIRDVGRALDLPYAYVDSVAKMIPQDLGITIEQALKVNPELSVLYSNDEQCKNLIDMSIKLEGLPRHTSMHAAGVVISNAPAINYVPLLKTSDDVITTQYTMTTLEELGLLKMDFLGLRTLTVIQSAINLVNIGYKKGYKHLTTGRAGELLKKGEFSVSDIDYDDIEVYNLIGSGNCEGIFQLESAGMKSFMKELKPQNLEDVIAGISLYRPGPMDFIPQYIKGKNNKDAIVYECEELKPILEPTYGCIVYQEQVMQIVRDLAGYSYGRSDLVRRAMSKKKADVMEKERQNFVYGNEAMGVKGCVPNGIDEKVANHIFDEMTDFASYAFNKSHAAAYAVVSFQTAYLKKYFPIEYMAALMTSVMDRTDKVAEYTMHLNKLGLSILPPSINEGFADFSTSEDGIRYGLSAIKSVGRNVIESIIDERKNGKYTDLSDFIKRLSGRDVNKRAVENFIRAGALDDLPGNRNQKLLTYAKIMDNISNERKHNTIGQMSLFDMSAPEDAETFAIRMPDVSELPKDELLAGEKEVLGIYVSGHPLEEYQESFNANITRTTAEFLPDEETGMPAVEDEEGVVIGGMIIDKTIKTTKTGSLMAFITVEDLMGSVEVIVFPRDFEKYKQMLDLDAKVYITGRATVEEDKPAKVIAGNVIAFDHLPKHLWLRFSDKDTYLKAEADIMSILKDSDGTDRVSIFIEKENAMKHLPMSMTVSVDSILLAALKQRIGEDNVRVVEKKIEKPVKK